MERVGKTCIEVSRFGVATAPRVPLWGRLVIGNAGWRVFGMQPRDNSLDLGRMTVIAHDDTQALRGPVLPEDGSDGALDHRHWLAIRGNEHGDERLFPLRDGVPF